MKSACTKNVFLFGYVSKQPSFVVICFLDKYVQSRDESDFSSDDDDDKLRAEALGVSEELILSFARRNGLEFDVALGRLLDKRSLSSKSTAVKALNFTDPSVRGVDVKKSIVEIEKYSKNIFSFKRELMKVVGTKNENELNRKIIDFEFKDPLIIICALGAQFDRLEKRYILNGISFKEAFARRLDFHHTLMSVCHDLAQFGICDNILHNIIEFSSEIINPKFDLNCVSSENTTISNIKNNSNDKPNVNDNITALAADRFAYDGNDFEYKLNEDLGCNVKLKTPFSDLYNKKRSHLGDNKETLKQQWIRGIRPKFCPNKSCWDFNFGIMGCPHGEACKNKKEEHLLSHFCAFCGDDDHPILQCQFIRCCTVLIKNNDNNWITRSYSTDLKKIAWQGRGRNNKRGGFRGGYRNSFNNTATRAPIEENPYRNSYMNDNFDYQDRFGQYDSYNNDTAFYSQQQHQQYHHHNNNDRRRGNRNKRRGGHSNNSNGNNQYNSSSHNGGS